MEFQNWNGKRTVAALIAAGGLALSASALAVPLNGPGGIVTGSNTVSDEDFEFLVDSGPGGVAGRIDVGDILVGAIGINAINGTPSGNFNEEITVIYALEATSVAGGLPGAVCGNAAVLSCSAFTFGAIGSGGSGFADINAVLAATAAATGVPGPYLNPVDDATPIAAGTVALVFTDPAKDFASPDIAGTTLAGVFTSSDGGQALLGATLGIGAGGVSGAAPAVLAELLLYADGAGAGSISVSFSPLQQDLPGFIITSDLNGLSGILKPASTNPTLLTSGVRTDTTLTFQAQVIPEPGMLGVLGLGLAGLGFASRRKRARA